MIYHVNTTAEQNYSRACFAAFVVASAVLASGCDGKGLFDIPEDGLAIQTYMFNYTPNEILYAGYHDARDKFNIVTAAPAGSTPLRTSAVTEIGSGISVRFDGGLCCFNWKYLQDEEVFVEVVWLEVYNPARYYRAERQTDERSVLTALPGSQWCKKRVKLRGPFPIDPGGVVMHFLPDGSIEATVAAAASIGDYEPYPAEKIVSYGSLRPGPSCTHPIDNPWYLIPRKKHRE